MGLQESFDNVTCSGFRVWVIYQLGIETPYKSQARPKKASAHGCGIDVAVYGAKTALTMSLFDTSRSSMNEYSV